MLERCLVEWRCFSDAEACHTSAMPGFVSSGDPVFSEKPAKCGDLASGAARALMFWVGFASSGVAVDVLQL